MDGSPHSKEQWTMPPLNMPWTTTVPSSIFLDGEKAFTTELERGTPPRRSSKGKAPGYSPKRGEAVYKAHRVNSCKPRKAESCKPFIARVVKQAREHKWSLDACCGYAKRQFLFNEQNCRIKQICSLPKDNLQPAYPRRHRELSRFLFKCTQIYS